MDHLGQLAWNTPADAVRTKQNSFSTQDFNTCFDRAPDRRTSRDIGVNIRAVFDGMSGFCPVSTHVGNDDLKPGHFC